MTPLKLTYSPDTDAAYLYIKPKIGRGEVEQTQLLLAESSPAEFNLDFDAQGMLLGIEILWASHVLSPEFLKTAE